MSTRSPSRFAALALVLCAACKSGRDEKPELRVGCFPNVTHAPALWAIETGELARALEPDVALKAMVFNAGPSVIEAIFAREVDIAYIGPSPVINAHVRTQGRGIVLLAGATEGGAQLVVRHQIGAPADLAGKKVGSPQLGNTQDVALRTWLRAQRIEAEVVPSASADLLALLSRGELAGAWLPEPWSSRAVIELKATVLVDERTLWPDGRFPTTVLAASPDFVEKRPELLERFLSVHERAVAAAGTPEGRTVVAAALAREYKKPVSNEVLERAFAQMSFGTELVPEHFEKLAADAHRLGFLKSADVRGLFGKEVASP